MTGIRVTELPGALGQRHRWSLPGATAAAEYALDRAVSWLRWAILATILLITLAWPLSSRTGHPLWIYILVFAAYNLLVELLRRRVRDRRYRAWLPVLDLLVASGLYYFDAEPGGPLFVLFYLAVVSAAVSMPLRGAFLYTLAAVVLVALIAPTLPLWASTNAYLRQFATRLLVLALVGVGTAFLARRLAAEQRALQGSEATLRLITAQMPAHIWTTDTDLRVTSVFGTGLTQLGVDTGSYVGRALHETRGPRDAVLIAHQRALAGEPARYEIGLAGRDFEARAEPLQDGEGRIVGVLGLAFDVTERKWDERRRAVQYEVTRLLAEAAGLAEAAPRILRVVGEGLGWDYGGLWAVDRHAGVLRCADTWHTAGTEFAAFIAASRRTAFAPGEGLPGSVWAGGEPRWVADTDQEATFPRLRVAAAEGLRAGVGVPIRLDGQVVGVLEFLSRRARESDPDVLALLAALGAQLGQFIERKRAEEELRTRARQQAAVAELGRRALATPDLDAVLAEAVELVARTLEVEYSKVLELLPGGETLLLRAGVGWRDGLVGRATVGAGRDSQAGYTLLSDEPVIVEDLGAETRFSGPPLLHEHGVVSGLSVLIAGADRPFGVLGVHTTRRRTFTGDDVHFLQAVANVLAAAIERRAVERQLAEERTEAERLTELDRLRNEFVASVSHDLRTPLTSARLATSALQGRVADRLEPLEGEFFGVLARSLDRLGHYIDNLVTVNQLDAGVLQLRREPLDLRALVMDAVEVVRPLLEEKGQALALDLPEPLPVEGDARRLDQVVINLLANAHIHTPAGTRIAVAGRREVDAIHLTVSDDGPGIPAADLERVFDRYYRLEAGRRGSGLGLAIVRSLVEAHEGRVWAASRPGGGATFHVTLPRCTPVPDEEAPQDVAARADRRG